MLGIGRPRQAAEGCGRRAVQEQQCEAAGGGRGRAAAVERRHQNGAPPQHQPHQDAAETDLISMVCRPLTRRCVPVTFTLLSAKGMSFEFCGSPGFELTGKYMVRSEEHTSELQSHSDLVCRLLLEKKKHGT